jgi:anti-sigma B factor antagonist
MPLTIAHEVHDRQTVLIIDGDLDLDTAPQLASMALGLVEAGAPDIVVDASRLRFCDSSGLKAFVRIANQLRASDGKLAIAAPPPAVRSALQISGLLEAFVVVDSVPAAISAINGTSGNPG